MASKRLFQLLVAAEDQPGNGIAHATLNNIANAKVLVQDPQVTYERTTFTREINRASYTPFTPIEGTVEGTLSCRVEVSGTSAAAGTAPDWDLLLQACGFKSRVITSYLLADESGGANAFFSAETITETADTAEVVHDTWEGATKIYTVDESADVTGSITGGTSTDTGTTSAPAANHGIAWTPTSRPVVTLVFDSAETCVAGDVYQGDTSNIVMQVVTATSASVEADVYWIDPGDAFLVSNETLTRLSGTGPAALTLSTTEIATQKYFPAITIGVIEDGVIRSLKGARGSVTFTANLGEPMYMDFEFRGLVNAISDGGLAGSAVSTALVPPSFLEISYGVGIDTPILYPADLHVPCINSWSLAYENTLAIEKCATATDGTRGAAFISNRAVTGSLDPSVRPESQFPWLDHFRQGTTFRQRLTLGDTAGNSFHISVPATQITSEGGGDRDGLATRDLQYAASGKAPDGTDLEDREVVLTLHQGAVYSD